MHWIQVCEDVYSAVKYILPALGCWFFSKSKAEESFDGYCWFAFGVLFYILGVATI